MGDGADAQLEREMQFYGVDDGIRHVRRVRPGRYAPAVVQRPLPWLHQNREWTTKAGETLTLEAMTASHRGNTYRMLERKAAQFHKVEEGWLIWNLLICNIDAAAWELERAAAELADTPPIDWLRTMPLMERLMELGIE